MFNLYRDFEHFYKEDEKIFEQYEYNDVQYEEDKKPKPSELLINLLSRIK